jgi:hypothetical protein
MAPMNFGNAFRARGERESGREEFEEMVAADRDTRKKLIEKAAPKWHDIAQENLDWANALLTQRQGTASAHRPDTAQGGTNASQTSLPHHRRRRWWSGVGIVFP